MLLLFKFAKNLENTWSQSRLTSKFHDSFSSAKMDTTTGTDVPE